MACLYVEKIHGASECDGKRCLDCKYHVENEPRETFGERYEAQRRIVDQPPLLPVFGEIWECRDQSLPPYPDVLFFHVPSVNTDVYKFMDRCGCVRVMQEGKIRDLVEGGDLRFVSNKCYGFRY